MAEKRKRTTMSGMPRDEKKYSIREFLDDYGPMSNLMRLLRGHDEEVPSMSPGLGTCLLYTSPSPRDGLLSRMPSSA